MGKIIAGFSDKIGKKTMHLVRKHLYLFSEKQQRFLKTESALAQRFPLDDGDEKDDDAEERAEEARKNQAKEMEEAMMARCRDFVREKASTFEDRRKDVEAQEAEAM